MNEARVCDRAYLEGHIVRKAFMASLRFPVTSAKRLMFLAGATSATFIAANAYAGGGGPTLQLTAQQLYVDDFTTAGALTTNYTVDGTDSLALTQSDATAGYETQIKLSADGSALVFDGYNSPVGGASVTTKNAIRSVGIMNGAGTIDTSTQFKGTSGTPVFNALWLGGANPILATAGKYSVTPYTSQISSTPATNYTFPNSSLPSLPGSPVIGNYFGGNYYATSNTTGYFGVNEINQTTFGITHLPGFPSTYTSANNATGDSDFVMADPDAANPYGFDTIYVTNSALGLQKWTYSGGTYSNVWTLGSNSTSVGFAADPSSTFLTSLTMTTDGLGDNVLYGVATDSVVKGSGANTYNDTYLVELTDLDSSVTAPTSYTELAASAPLEQFAGVAFAPTGTAFGTGDLAVLQIGGSAVPEPASLGLIGIGAVSLLGRRRRGGN